MTEKKTSKKEKPAVKKAAKPKINTPTIKKEVLVEDRYSAAEIAKNLSVSDFAFLIIKRQSGINDGTLLTIAEFRELYKKIIGR